MSVIYFTEENHKYETKDGEWYQSVSGLWKPYSKPFDGKAIAIKKAFQDLDSKLYNTLKRDLKYNHPDFISEGFKRTKLPRETIEAHAQAYMDQWDDKRDTGTSFHAKEENMDLERGYRVNHFTGKKAPVVKWDIEDGWDNQSCPHKLIDIPDGYINEHLVKSDLHKTAGQIDQNFIETINGTRYIDIDDWKTDKEVKLKPSFFHPQFGYETMYYPFDHIYSTNYWKYCMKISTYAYMMELEGFTPRNLAFTHVVIDKEDLSIIEQKRYPVPYKRFEAKMALERYLETQK